MLISPGPFVRELFRRIKEDEVTALAAQLTYHLILAFFPFLFFLLTLAGYTNIAGEKVLTELGRLLPSNTYDTVLQIIYELLEQRSSTLLSFSMLATVWIASSGLSAITRGINKAFDQRETRPIWKLKIFSVIYTIGFALILLLLFIAIVFGEIFGKYIFDFLGYPHLFSSVWNTVRYIMSFVSAFLLLAAIYFLLPNRKMKFREIIPGSIFSSFLWIFISLLFSFYVNNFNNYSRIYGSIGGVMVLLLWLYWSSIIILTGGEINATLSHRRQSKGLKKIFKKRQVTE